MKHLHSLAISLTLSRVVPPKFQGRKISMIISIVVSIVAVGVTFFYAKSRAPTKPLRGVTSAVFISSNLYMTVCLYVYIFVYGYIYWLVYIHMYVCKYIYVYTCILCIYPYVFCRSLRKYIYLYVYILYTYICIFIYVYTYKYICIYTYVYVCTCICIRKNI